MTESQVTERDVDSLANKLEAFGASLTPGERAALAALVQLADVGSNAAAGPEVTGHMLDPFTAKLLAEARHRELLAEAERYRMASQARASQPPGEGVWDRLKRYAGETTKRD